jgi:transcriptional regulator
MPVMLTLRKTIAEALENEPLDVREISQRFHLREKEVLDHLQHIARSAHGKRLIVEPAACGKCGFSFKKRERLSTPSRCPVCRNEQILSPRFQILSTSS